MSLPNDRVASTQKIYEGIEEVFETLFSRYKKYDRDHKRHDKVTLHYITKLVGSIGYIAQCHASLAKEAEYDMRLSEIEKAIGIKKKGKKIMPNDKDFSNDVKDSEK